MAKPVREKKTAGSESQAKKKAGPKAPKKAGAKKSTVKRKASHAAGDLPVNSFELDESDYSQG